MPPLDNWPDVRAAHDAGASFGETRLRVAFVLVGHLGGLQMTKYEWPQKARKLTKNQ